MTSKIIIFDGYWSIVDVKNNPDSLFVYGDNNIGRGKAGQAIIRDLPNTIGIPTKRYPSKNPDAFYNDSEYINNTRRISQAIDKIIQRSVSYRYVVLPKQGFGTGLAELPKRAPRTYEFLVQSIERLKKTI